MLRQASEEYAMQLSDVLEVLSRIISAFRNVISDIARHRNEIYTSLSPVTILPPESLQMIFMIGRSQADHELSYLQSISRVSSAWRATALGCHPLWNRIYPVASPYMEVDISQAQISRAGECPLELILDRDPYNPTYDGRLPSETFNKLIRQHWARWRRIESPSRISGITLHLIHLISSLQLPNLQSLSLTVAYRGPTLPENVLGGLPRLRRLELSGFTMADAPSPGFSRTLNYLELNYCSTNMSWWRALSRICTALEVLKIYNVTLINPFESTDDIVLGSLVTLIMRRIIYGSRPEHDIVNEPYQWSAFFLRRIQTPALRYLDASVSGSLCSWANLTKIVSNVLYMPIRIH